jgi:hypothetical protein
MKITTTGRNTQLEKQEPQFFLEKMNSSEIAIVQATEGKRIGQMSENEKTILAGKIISIGNIRLGYKPKSEKDTTAELMLFVLDLSKFLGLTEQELLFALNLGLDGEFLKENETVFFSSANFVHWVKKYIESKKMPAMAKHHNNKVVAERETPKPEPTNDELKKIAIDNANFYVERFKNDNFEFTSVGINYLYDNAVKSGILIQLDEDVRCEIFLVNNEFPLLNETDMEIRVKENLYRNFIHYMIEKNIVFENGI